MAKSAAQGIGPLAGLRVLDLTQFLAGPYATMIFADLGAEVVKLEAPVGDWSRILPPNFVGDDSSYYLSINRNKKSIAIDMKTDAGRDLVLKMAASSDVFVENFRPGVAKRLGVDYETLRELNPRLVYCSISAYGQEGMMSDRPGLDPVFQAEMGLMSLCGEIDGSPMRHPLSIIDLFTSLYASTAVCAAVVDQKATGTGRHIDVSLMGGATLSDITLKISNYIIGNDTQTGSSPTASAACRITRLEIMSVNKMRTI